MRRLVPPRHLPDALVASGQDDDSDEGEDERERARDTPLAEDDAEVLEGPGEEHLHGRYRAG